MLITPSNPVSLTEVRIPIPESIPDAIPPTTRAQQNSQSTPENRPFDDTHRKDTNNVDRAIHRFLENIGGKNSELAISIDGATQKIVVKVLDATTKEVIKQIPPKELLALAENLNRVGTGIFDEIA